MPATVTVAPAITAPVGSTTVTTSVPACARAIARRGRRDGQTEQTQQQAQRAASGRSETHGDLSERSLRGRVEPSRIDSRVDPEPIESRFLGGVRAGGAPDAEGQLQARRRRGSPRRRCAARSGLGAGWRTSRAAGGAPLAADRRWRTAVHRGGGPPGTAVRLDRRAAGRIGRLPTQHDRQCVVARRTAAPRNSPGPFTSITSALPCGASAWPT